MDRILAFGGKGMPAVPCCKERFSDGVVVIEVMPNALNLPLVNYAFAGARSGYDKLPSSTAKLDANALYMLRIKPASGSHG